MRRFREISRLGYAIAARRALEAGVRLGERGLLKAALRYLEKAMEQRDECAIAGELERFGYRPRAHQQFERVSQIGARTFAQGG